MIQPDASTIDYTCRDCAHMHRDKDGGRWCSSPQILKHMGHSIRCVWERDHIIEGERSRFTDTAKCGPKSVNFKRRETV